MGIILSGLTIKWGNDIVKNVEDTALVLVWLVYVSNTGARTRRLVLVGCFFYKRTLNR